MIIANLSSFRSTVGLTLPALKSAHLPMNISRKSMSVPASPYMTGGNVVIVASVVTVVLASSMTVITIIVAARAPKICLRI